MAGNIGNGGVETVLPQIAHATGDSGGDKDNPPEADNAQDRVLFLGDLMSRGVRFAEVTRGESGEVRHKLPLARSP